VAPVDGVGGVLEGIAEVSNGGTRARIGWTLAAHPDGTAVTVEAVVERAAPLDALLLRCGGRRWLERRLLAGAVADLAALQRR
jgi:hypothetical protein